MLYLDGATITKRQIDQDPFGVSSISVINNRMSTFIMFRLTNIKFVLLIAYI